MKLNYTAIPSITSPTSFRVDTVEFMGNHPGDILSDTYRKYSTSVLETREKAIREGLIALGWTPPPPEESKNDQT